MSAWNRQPRVAGQTAQTHAPKQQPQQPQARQAQTSKPSSTPAAASSATAPAAVVASVATESKAVSSDSQYPPLRVIVRAKKGVFMMDGPFTKDYKPPASISFRCAFVSIDTSNDDLHQLQSNSRINQFLISKKKKKKKIFFFFYFFF